MIVLDASVVIAHFTSGDAHSSRAFEILDTEEELALHHLAVAEVLVHPARDAAESTIVAALQKIGIRQLPVEQDEPVRIARLRASTGLRMTDTCVLAAALHERAALATFDDRLTGVARELGVQVHGA